MRSSYQQRRKQLESEVWQAREADREGLRLEGSARTGAECQGIVGGRARICERRRPGDFPWEAL